MGLTENWIYNQIAGLNDVVTRVYAVVRENEDSFPFDDIRCLGRDLRYFPLLFNRVWNKYFLWYPQFLIWLWKDRPDLIHAHFGLDGYRILPCARMLGLPLVTSFYGYDAYLFPRQDPRWNDRYSKLFRHGRLFLVEGPAMRERLIELGCPREKVVVHRVGIKLGKYMFRARRPDGEILLMVCGRFVEKKGIPYAVEALRRIQAKSRAPVRLFIVGDSDAGGTMTGEKRRILHAVERCGLADSVTITGYVPHDEMLKIAYGSHILLAPSIRASDGNAEGGFPVVITEALATGMPVVGFDHCDIPHIVQDGKSGFIVPERDVDALAEKTTFLIEHPELWVKMGGAGRKYVEEHFDIEKLNRRLIDVYRSLVEGGS